MPLIFIGPLAPETSQILACLGELGQAITVAPELSDLPPLPGAIAIVALTATPALAQVASLARAQGWTWLGWNHIDSPALALAAYQAGARSVLPAHVTTETIRQALADLTTALPAPVNGHRPRGVRLYRYRPGNVILPEADTVVEVREGIIAIGVVHSDGAQVLLGLCGPGHMLVSHPHDTCSLQLIAHTEAAVVLHTWAEVSTRPDFPQQLRLRLQHLEAWAAMQARPHLDQRLLGLLSLLAEQFGKPHPQGTLIDVRITHAQLSAAAGATRTTITRTLGDLRARGLLITVGSGDGERICLREPEGANHSQLAAHMPAMSH